MHNQGHKVYKTYPSLLKEILLTFKIQNHKKLLNISSELPYLKHASIRRLQSEGEQEKK